MIPRYYQTDGVNSVWNYFCAFLGNPIVAMPTGTGKSYVIAMLLQKAFFSYPGSRVLCATHVKELIEQNAQEILDLWPMAPLGIYSAGIGRKEVRPITFAGIASIATKAQLLGWIDFVIIDECHLLGPEEDSMYRELIAALTLLNSKVKVVGLTATPYRLGQGLLTDPTFTKDGKPKPPLFTDICYDITKRDAFNRLVEEGFICTLISRKTDVELDVSKVHTMGAGGDFKQGELERAVDHDETTYAALREAIALGHDRKHWLVFATGKSHIEHIVAALESLGISARGVHSKTSKEDRKKFIEEFKTGKVRALVNNKIFTTGFNFKPIDLIIDLQPTTSASKHVQKYGRGTRPSPETGKVNCLVLDFAGNRRRLGPINDPILPKSRGAATGKAGQALVRVCQSCFTYNEIHATVCCNCGEWFPPPEVKINDTAETEDMIVGAPPRYDVLKVKNVDFATYVTRNPNKPKIPSLLVTYHCGQRNFMEWQCFEHTGIASKRARDWWRDAADDWESKPPESVADAIKNLNRIRRATHLRIWVNTPDPKIMSYDYSNTGFGTVLPP